MLGIQGLIGTEPDIIKLKGTPRQKNVIKAILTYET